ncbi:MAG: Mg(2+)-transport-ATPase-associated protein MgtC [Candidatus Bipolaricaulis sibiricus]|uniref:Mg(2+)-transport-ATPase-associated protein MgtC n=1 Tax=Bipolaricaulis sibiricus TaxID=2501609 RepID=A0A410FTU2_BIPS1|nr:MAG: Mg(2+)-transport-ATPase-associated protein MgtC [Candidatus Bipolaricaulis sibiricus]
MSVLEPLGRILFAAVVGGTIGLERELRGRAAGLRTHILVCVGAAVVMVVAAALDQVDGPGRALAGIVTGVGFLGAGAIIKTRDIVRGVTTAACIWLVAALGAVAGQGLYALAAGSAAIALLVLLALNQVERLVPAHSYHTVIVRGSGTAAQQLEALCREVFAREDHRVLALDVDLEQGEDRLTLTFYLRSRGVVRAVPVAEALLAIPGVSSVRWR